MEYVAFARAEQLLHAVFEHGEVRFGHPGLDGAGEAAAVDPDSPHAVQQVLSHAQGQGDGLLPGVVDGPGVLQVEGGGQPGLVYQGQEEVKVPVFEGRGLQICGAVVVIEVHGPEHRPVAALRPQGGKGRLEISRGHVPQDGFTEVSRHRPHLPGDVGVVVGKIAMAGCGVHNAQGKARPAEIVVHPLHNGVGWVVEVNKHRTPHRGAHLVHQAAGLAEVCIFGVLADFGDGDRVQLVRTAEVVEDIAHQRLVGGGGGKSRAGQDGGDHAGVKAGQGIAQLLYSGGYPPHQGGGGVFLLLPNGQVVQGDLQGGVALGLNADTGQPVGNGAGQHVHVHAAAQHPAVLVVGVVAADLGAARAAEQGGGGVVLRAERIYQGLDHPAGPVPCLVKAVLRAVQGVEGGEGFVVGSGAQGVKQSFTGIQEMSPHSLYFMGRKGHF